MVFSFWPHHHHIKNFTQLVHEGPRAHSAGAGAAAHFAFALALGSRFGAGSLDEAEATKCFFP